MQEQRLVTLKAMGGIGKTRLALELARETVVHATSETSFPSEVAARHIHSNGIWFVDLAVIADNALVINAVLAELSLKAEADRSALLTLTNAIKGQKLLIVLDNCEQVIEGAAELASSVLRHCPQVYLLCTSREALNVEGETVFALSALSRDEALALFTVRAKAVRTGFAVDASNQAVLEQLVERLDGISLAIELAAARMRNLSLTEIVRLLDDRFAVLTGGSRIALPRQQTLHALIDWSYQLLSEPEKVLFRRLAVFNGDFPLAHAKAICCALPPLAERDALDLISHLVDKSLLLMEDATTASSTCAGNVVEPPPQQYRLLETVGAYALEALKASDNETSLRQAHAKFYATQAEAARKTIPTEAWGQWKERIHKNHSNYRCALEWALAEQNDIPSGTAIATGLGRYWNESGMSPMALQWLELALCHSAALAPLLRGRLVYTLGSTCMNLGRYSQAVTQLRESITLLDCEPEDQAFLGEACTDLAVCLSAIGQLAEATSLFERAAAIAMQAGNDRSYEFALGNLAADLAFQGRFDEADEALARQLKRHGAKMAPEEKVLCMIRRALIAIPRGAAEEARPWLDEALPLIHVLGDHPDALLCLLGALRVQIALDQWAAAAALAQRALDMLRRQPQSRFFPLVAEGVALLMNRQGQSELAARSLGLANRLYVEMSMNRSAMRKTDFDATMESLRSALGEAAVAQHLAEGTALTLEAFFAEAQRFCAAVANK